MAKINPEKQIIKYFNYLLQVLPIFTRAPLRETLFGVITQYNAVKSTIEYFKSEPVFTLFINTYKYKYTLNLAGTFEQRITLKPFFLLTWTMNFL